MAKLIYKCAVDGSLGMTAMYRGRKIGAICGNIKVGSDSICGAHGNFKCRHKVKKPNTCGNCEHLAFGDMMGLKSAYCSFGRNDFDGPIVPHYAEFKDGKRGNPTVMKFWRIPKWCERPDSEVTKSDKKAKEPDWVVKTV